MTLTVSNPSIYQAALYIRLSREDENEGPSQSVTNQQALLTDFAKKQALFVYDVYIDDGYSGTTFDRPAFQRMIRDIESKRVNMVITKDLSRLGRDYILTGHYMERYFPEKQVRYLSLLDGIDTGVESSANDITPFRAIMNDMYAKDISKKIKAVKHAQQRSGLFVGGKPMYGYRMHPTLKNKIVADENTAPIVRRMFAMAAQGESCRQIAARLNEERIPSPAAYASARIGAVCRASGRWSAERVAQMLTNQTYIGHMVQGRTVKVNYKSRKSLPQPPENWVIVPNTHHPLVDAATFAAVQKHLASRRHTRSRTYDHLLKGLIFCHECGHPLAVLNRPDAKGNDRLFFECRTYQRFTKNSACSCHSIKVQTVTDAVLSAVQSLCNAALSRDALMSIAMEAVQNAQPTAADVNALRSQCEQLSSHLDRLYIDKLNGLLAQKDFERLSKRITAEREKLHTQLSTYQKQALSAEDRASALVGQFCASIAQRRDVLVSLLERVELSRHKQLILRFRCASVYRTPCDRYPALRSTPSS